jgi:hypothetical protein
MVPLQFLELATTIARMVKLVEGEKLSLWVEGVEVRKGKELWEFKGKGGACLIEIWKNPITPAETTVVVYPPGVPGERRLWGGGFWRKEEEEKKRLIEWMKEKVEKGEVKKIRLTGLKGTKRMEQVTIRKKGEGVEIKGDPVLNFVLNFLLSVAVST